VTFNGATYQEIDLLDIVKFGERFKMPIPSQAIKIEGVET